MAARAFALIGDDLLAGIERLLVDAAGAWRDDWGVAADELSLECSRAWEAERQLPAAPDWRRSWRGGDASLSLAWNEELPAQLQRLMFSPDRRYAADNGPAPIAASAALAAWDAWQRQLAALAVPDAGHDQATPGPAHADWARGSGAILLILRLGRQACHGVLSHAAVQMLARQAALRGHVRRAQAPPLAAVDHRALLASTPVSLQIEVGKAALSLGSLSGLQVGDVIRLDAAADQPLSVSGPDGTLLFNAYLGLKDQMVALEVVRPNNAQHK